MSRDLTLVCYDDADGHPVVLGAFTDLQARRRACKAFTANRAQRVDEQTAWLMKTYRFSEKDARRRANEQAPRLYYRTVPENDLLPVDLYPAPTVAKPIPPIPCPAGCGAMITEYMTDTDTLTWCDQCNWHGYSLTHLLTGDAKGAELW